MQIAVSNALKLFYILFIFITTGILPMIMVGVLKLMGKLNSILLDDKDDRTTPYIITACLYLFDYYFLLRFGAPHILIAYLLACSCIVVAVLIINIFYKISIHTASLGALIAVLISASQIADFDIRILLSIAIIIAGLTATARLLLNAHTPFQLYSGFAVGTIIMLLIL